ncbi:diacylglycerol kinase (ATP) [Brevibacillus aydinogluensis]|jgi:diacylglycerol kinase (ATP)|uniref:Diacylglycerol kinase n=1 Tax=Brevibacillus aydinogluensis TaxID=927786 RepID=A0AA48MAA8_9BACL|nr:diacylglycerol kinase [Brevibacillus aydinogluensis]NNV02369.1 diacylglycerol kinase [Brevibacillus sp. MCWH]REK66883.1 MAG: diacylglycerol kinase [Brevibacillus sp.]UFJ62703.1 diacylglycerol kinase [Anoxybacillus sediminis]MDT3416386.1 diacylglycerol kinase (ATP) [Brevibacillus aydinogluensis]CAJ1004162.1 diacylglycerol kinase [Brevibacillus aydinogluensis]
MSEYRKKGHALKRARLIYNPSSGREIVRRRLPDILELLESAGYETSCYATKGEDDATEEAERAVKRGFDVIIAAGGDGTIYEVVNGMAGKPARPALGIIPCGTSNDFARALGIPKSITRSCKIIAAGKRKRVDVGRINNRYFINIAGGGSLTNLTYEVPSKLKTLLGQLAYYVKGLEKLPSLHPIRVKLETRDKVLVDEEIMIFLITNSHSVGGFDRLAPNADISDGKLDLIVVKKVGLGDFIRLAAQAIRGEHVKDPNLLYFQTDYIKATSPSGETVQLNLDGELGGELPCVCEALPGHLELFVP